VDLSKQGGVKMMRRCRTRMAVVFMREAHWQGETRPGGESKEGCREERD